VTLKYGLEGRSRSLKMIANTRTDVTEPASQTPQDGIDGAYAQPNIVSKIRIFLLSTRPAVSRGRTSLVGEDGS